MLLVVTSLSAAWPPPGLSQTPAGTVVLVGGVLRFNQRNVWRRITEQAPELVVIAAASERPKLYGGYARRALERHGAYAEVLPVALDAAEFGIDHRHATSDPALTEMVREADGVFFVGGAPQRLASVLIRADGSPTPLGNAVADAHAAGGVVVGGVAGSVALSTGVDAFEALASGRVPSTALHRGLGLVDGDWFIDQHAFSAGRLAEILVAMRQLGVTRGLGIGANTAAVVRAGGVEVIGDEGVLVIDLSGAGSDTGSRAGLRLAGGRISYLESGDRLDMSSLAVTPSAAKQNGFEIEPVPDATQASEEERPVVADLCARGGLQRLLREALDGARREAFGVAFPQGPAGEQRGFRFRFHSMPGTAGWLSVDSGAERYTIANLGLEVAIVRRDEVPAP